MNQTKKTVFIKKWNNNGCQLYNGKSARPQSAHPSQKSNRNIIMVNGNNKVYENKCSERKTPSQFSPGRIRIQDAVIGQAVSQQQINLIDHMTSKSTLSGRSPTFKSRKDSQISTPLPQNPYILKHSGENIAIDQPNYQQLLYSKDPYLMNSNDQTAHSVSKPKLLQSKRESNNQNPSNKQLNLLMYNLIKKQSSKECHKFYDTFTQSFENRENNLLLSVSGESLNKSRNMFNSSSRTTTYYNKKIRKQNGLFKSNNETPENNNLQSSNKTPMYQTQKSIFDKSNQQNDMNMEIPTNLNIFGGQLIIETPNLKNVNDNNTFEQTQNKSLKQLTTQQNRPKSAYTVGQNPQRCKSASKRPKPQQMKIVYDDSRTCNEDKLSQAKMPEYKRLAKYKHEFFFETDEGKRPSVSPYSNDTMKQYRKTIQFNKDLYNQVQNQRKYISLLNNNQKTSQLEDNHLIDQSSLIEINTQEDNQTQNDYNKERNKESTLNLRQILDSKSQLYHVTTQDLININKNLLLNATKQQYQERILRKNSFYKLINYEELPPPQQLFNEKSLHALHTEQLQQKRNSQVSGMLNHENTGGNISELGNTTQLIDSRNQSGLNSSVAKIGFSVEVVNHNNQLRNLNREEIKEEKRRLYKQSGVLNRKFKNNKVKHKSIKRV